MKNLMVFVNARKTFKGDYRNEMDTLAKLQVDNSLAFGWKREDIIIATNFEWEYNGVRSVVLPDTTFSPKKRTVSKINGIIELIDRGIIGDEVCWFHDFDAFQNAEIREVVLGNKLVALTKSSVDTDRLSTGVMCFTKDARELFKQIQHECYTRQVNEELGLRRLLQKAPEWKTKIGIMNISCNFAIKERYVYAQYRQSDMPIRVLHFHPTDDRFCMTEKDKTSMQVVYGDNSFKTALIGDILKESFAKHGLHS